MIFGNFGTIGDEVKPRGNSKVPKRRRVMLRIVAFLFCFNVMVLQNLYAQETLKDYLGVSENEIEEIRKIERIYSGEDILVPSLIGDQAEWTQVNPREILSYYCRNMKDWVGTTNTQFWVWYGNPEGTVPENAPVPDRPIVSLPS